MYYMHTHLRIFFYEICIILMTDIAKDGEIHVSLLMHNCVAPLKRSDFYLMLQLKRATPFEFHTPAVEDIRNI